MAETLTSEEVDHLIEKLRKRSESLAKTGADQAAPLSPWSPPTLADVVSLAGYGLGIWWALGGPNWAGLASIGLDELDGRLARAMGTAGPRGGDLDWGIDMALVPLSLLRLGKVVDSKLPVLASPSLMFASATLRSAGQRPPVGSVRAVVMLATMAAEVLKDRK